MKKTVLMLAVITALAIFLAACGQAAIGQPPVTLSTGGTLLLKVNPEIAIVYDADGNVTGVDARNADAKAILEGYSFQGKDTKTVVSELVGLIGDAGYFVEEIDGEVRRITLEIEPGSALPSDRFLEDVVAEVKALVDQYHWNTPLDVDDTLRPAPADPTAPYVGTDYGVTDYNDTPYGQTDYHDTDYGPNADGVTDYNDTPYGQTDYDDTDYRATGSSLPRAQQETPQQEVPPTEYRGTDYGVTDYNDTPYGQTDYNDTPYGQTDYEDTPYGNTDYDGTDYR